MTPRVQWLLAACGLAGLGLVFVWGISRMEQRVDSQGVHHVPTDPAGRRIQPRTAGGRATGT